VVVVVDEVVVGGSVTSGAPVDAGPASVVGGAVIGSADSRGDAGVGPSEPEHATVAVATPSSSVTARAQRPVIGWTVSVSGMLHQWVANRSKGKRSTRSVRS
jgi:hypothetical protein